MLVENRPALDDYLAFASDPPPGNMGMRCEVSRRTNIHIGFCWPKEMWVIARPSVTLYLFLAFCMCRSGGDPGEPLPLGFGWTPRLIDLMRRRMTGWQPNQ
jgi:hypothetical protein